MQCIFEDHDGNMLFGSGPMTFEGIGVYDGTTLTNFRPRNENWIRSFTATKTGTILICTRRIGVYSYDGEKFASFNQPKELKNDLLNCIFMDKSATIWYASDYLDYSDFSSGRLWKYDGNSFVGIAKDNELKCTAITFMLQDKSGNIWLDARMTGLFKYDGNSFKNFSE